MVHSPIIEALDDQSPGLEALVCKGGADEAELIDVAGNRPLMLHGCDQVWLVHTGKVDIFAIRMAEGRPMGPQRHLFRAERGGLLFGIDPELSGGGMGLVARGSPGTRLLNLTLSQVRELVIEPASRAAATEALDGWVTGLALGLAREERPQAYVLLEPGETALTDQDIAIPREGVLWIKPLAGRAHVLGQVEVAFPAGGDYLPTSRDVWIQASGPTTLYAIPTEAWLRHDRAWHSLAAYHQAVLQCLRLVAEHEAQDERIQLDRKAATQRIVVQQAWAQLGGLLAPDASQTDPLLTGSEADPLLATCSLVGIAAGIELRAPRGVISAGTVSERVRAIARASAVRSRQVGLRDAWWRGDHGPLVGIDEELERPVALLPRSGGGYTLHDPVTHTHTLITADIAARLAPFATAFYRSFPARAITTWNLVRFGVHGCGDDFRMIMLMGVIMALLGLITPLATGYIFDIIVPAADHAQLIIIGMLLLMVAFAMALFEITRSVALLRIEGKMSNAIQAAVWDRVLNLPVPFFRNYTAGDLGNRAMGINSIRDVIAGPVVRSLLAGIFSLVNFGLLFYINGMLALAAVALILVAIAVTMAAGSLQLRYQRRLAAVEGQISGLVLQLISGITKFRVAGVEGRAFAVWAQAFSRQKKLDYQKRTVVNGLTVFQAAYPVVTVMALFAMVALATRSDLSTGDFLAFSSGFSQLLFAALELSSAVIAILGVVPLYERAKPILHTMPEVDTARDDPGVLTGDIEISQLSFRYQEQGPLILNDISIHIRRGEFVALVGSSGSGKSTLFRLLLGFEMPGSGAIYYDGQDLNRLDVRAVRQQIGVVLQNGKLTAGSLLENIIGSAPLTLEDAMEAVRMAGLEADIQQMPMGMHTFISDGGGTLSGGQRQRLLIARAIVKRPRIVLFDEATSALDNRTQQIVSESLKRLQATRIVIAHRLSTIINADRIFVLDRGKIVQCGTYHELIDQPGPFAELVKRQLV